MWTNENENKIIKIESNYSNAVYAFSILVFIFKSLLLLLVHVCFSFEVGFALSLSLVSLFIFSYIVLRVYMISSLLHTRLEWVIKYSLALIYSLNVLSRSCFSSSTAFTIKCDSFAIFFSAILASYKWLTLRTANK